MKERCSVPHTAPILILSLRFPHALFGLCSTAAPTFGRPLLVACFPSGCFALRPRGLSAQVLDWIENHGEAFLSKHTGVGKSLHRARALQKRHEDFEEVAQVSRTPHPPPPPRLNKKKQNINTSNILTNQSYKKVSCNVCNESGFSSFPHFCLFLFVL